MSRIALSGAATGSATFTIESPATNTSRILNLPDAAGTLDRLQRAGNVLQVVQATTSTTVTVSTATYTDTGLSASITPTSATSKILIFVNQTTRVSRSGNSAEFGSRLLRGSTNILVPLEDGTGPYEFGGSAVGPTALVYATRASINYLDSPNTTSSVTYKTQGRPYFSETLNFQPTATTNGTSTIILMEIAA